MKYKLFYGGEQELTQEDRQRFSKGDYECKALMQTKDGKPVIISQHKDDPSKCKVEYGYSCLAFRSLDDAFEYCVGRFKGVSGGGA